MTALALIKKNLERDVLEYSTKLTAFDKIFDEDVLDAKYEQLNMIKNDIENSELYLMNCMISSNDLLYMDNESYTRISEKMELLYEKEAQVNDEINQLIEKRDSLYTTWKSDYIRNAEHFADAQRKLRQINEIECSLMKLIENNVKANNNIILLVYIHTQINKLLQLANIKKEKSPKNAFRVAFNNGLISDNVYHMLQL